MPKKLDFDFELGEPILHQIQLLNKALMELNVAGLNENPDFLVNQESAGTFGIDFRISPQNKNTVDLWLLMQGDGLRIDIDGIPETFEWSYKDLQKSEREVIDFIKELFTSYILLEDFPSRTKMSLFNSKGVRTKQYTLRYYLSLKDIFKMNPKQNLFFPIYSLVS